MVEPIYCLKPAWCGRHLAGLRPETGLSVRYGATAFKAVGYHLMRIITGKTFVRLESVAVEVRSNFHIVTNELLEFVLAARLNHLGANLSAALQDCSNDSLTLRPTSVNLFCTLALV